MRRLRLGYPGGSLYKKPGETSYTVDISHLRHKYARLARLVEKASTPDERLFESLCRTSRFYGPQVSTLPATIQPFVEAWEATLVFECTGENPYLFPTAGSYQYGQTSSGWTQLVKSVFERHAGVPCPPKQLRASFCTYLRSAEGIDEELLASCAHAMKHQVATGGSDNCTRQTHDCLCVPNLLRPTLPSRLPQTTRPPTTACSPRPTPFARAWPPSTPPRSAHHRQCRSRRST